MEGYEEDDDTHFCIKCHSTVHGLENYVRHRQSGCRPTDDKSEEGPRVSPSTPTTVSYPEILNADAFFSSLELQSSSKSNPRRAAGLLEESRKLKKDERRRKRQKSQADAEEPAAKEKLQSMLPGVADLDDPTEHLCIPSLVGFPDIVSSSSGKPAAAVAAAATVVQNKLSQPISHPATSMGGSSTFSTKHEAEHSLESLMSAETKQQQQQAEGKRQEENQRIEQVHQNWLEDTILADLVGNNENKELARYEFEYQQDDDSEEDILEDLVEEDSYSESDEGEDRERPPHGHTGGKWKPGLDHLPQNMSQLHEEDVEVEDDHQEHPPPSYTGGKWRPTETNQAEQRLLRKIEEYEAKDSAGQPPPGHTRGKWVPGARADIESGYWCSPCGRKLASRLVYNRHLLSDLHARRSIREIDGALHLPRQAEHTGLRRTRVQKAREEAEVEDRRKEGCRRREKEVLSCEMCHARVRRPQMGKHLLSHYHCRVAGVNPRGPRARRFLLENMANVVRQCPFQCSSCRFYCNTEETFLRHWRSDLHGRTLQQIAGTYRCTPCDFWCETNGEMETHLVSAAHREFVSMMNGSVPIVIARQQIIPCGNCDQRFRYNFQLRLHMRATGHEGSWTASDQYQLRIKCDACPRVLRSLVSLQRHQLTCHSTKDSIEENLPRKPDSLNPYFCSFCSMNFASAQEAVLHRRTSRHKEIVKARKHGDASAGTSRECTHCGEKQSNLAEHKEHLLTSHPELCHSCPRCGGLFALSQDVTKHTRAGECRLAISSDKKLNAANSPSTDKEEWKCSSCTFATDSQAEFIFHEAIHSPPVESDAPTCSNFAPKYACPVCKRLFTKVSLRNHIRSHTGERPFGCPKCFATFSRRSDLNSHQRECAPGTSSNTDWTERGQRIRSFHCSECSSAFYTKHALRQHMLRHAGKKYKCGLPGCPTVLRTASELRSHRALVHESTSAERRFQCSQCDYAAKTKTQLRRHLARHEDTEVKTKIVSCRYPGCTFRTKIASHLRRHVRLHTGAKPYKCPHCSYASNNLENLRKHVLSTNLHPGKTIYECSFCKGDSSETFHTNFAKELRAHLSSVHSNSFPTPGSASDYVFGIFGSRVEEGQATAANL